MDLHDFYYDLPQELIAQDPLSDRSSSRLMVLDKKTGAIEHKIFKDIIDYLNPGDCLVINDTKVIPARRWEPEQLLRCFCLPGRMILRIHGKYL